MRYVLDSCVAIKWFLAEPDSSKAIRVLDKFNRQIHDLLAPDAFPVEVAHALSRAVASSSRPPARNTSRTCSPICRRCTRRCGSCRGPTRSRPR